MDLPRKNNNKVYILIRQYWKRYYKINSEVKLIDCSRVNNQSIK